VGANSNNSKIKKHGNKQETKDIKKVNRNKNGSSGSPCFRLSRVASGIVYPGNPGASI